MKYVTVTLLREGRADRPQVAFFRCSHYMLFRSPPFLLDKAYRPAPCRGACAPDEPQGLGFGRAFCM
jgi:hypothetical protein